MTDERCLPWVLGGVVCSPFLLSVDVNSLCISDLLLSLDFNERLVKSHPFGSALWCSG